MSPRRMSLSANRYAYVTLEKNAESVMLKNKSTIIYFDNSRPIACGLEATGDHDLDHQVSSFFQIDIVEFIINVQQ